MTGWLLGSLLVLLSGLALAGLTGAPVTAPPLRGPAGDLPAAVELADTPFFPQTGFHCGPAALAAGLGSSGVATTPEALAPQVFTPGRQGSLQADMVTAARRHGRLPIPIDGMTGALREVAAGRPVLILQNLSLEIAPQWHYALLVGYDLTAGDAVLRSGTEPRFVTPLTTLEQTWRRAGFWGFVLARPEGPVPATASPADWLAQAAGLERAGRRPEAAGAYRTAIARWPDRPEPRIGLANALYADGDMAGAEAALRTAVAAAPDDAAALNNLAHVLLEQGRLDEAERLAERAVARGGPHSDAALRTVAAIRLRRAGCRRRSGQRGERRAVGSWGAGSAPGHGLGAASTSAARSRSAAKSTKARTRAAARRPSRCTSCTGIGGGSQSASTIASWPCRTSSAT